jgi:hypothetical protein
MIKRFRDAVAMFFGTMFRRPGYYDRPFYADRPVTTDDLIFPH